MENYPFSTDAAVFISRKHTAFIMVCFFVFKNILLCKLPSSKSFGFLTLG
jgi:hypothetical protein